MTSTHNAILRLLVKASKMLRSFIRILLLILVLLFFTIPFYFTWKYKAYRTNSALVKISFYFGRLILGINVTINGMPANQLPLLIVSNHFSYLDVFVLGSLMPLRFTPKSEVASWPVVGFYCKINGCIFIDRRPSQALRNKEILEEIVKEKNIVSIFPEGTSNDGTTLLPFRSSLLSITENQDVAIQPVTINYTKLNHNPVTADDRHIIGWYGDMEFLPHLLAFTRQLSTEVTVIFHEPVNGKDFPSRKDLATYCHDTVESALIKY